MPWFPVALLSDLADRDVIGRECGGHRVAIYRLDGAYHATQAVCTHANALLCEGEVVEGFIECPLHAGLFDIRTGRAQGAPVTRDLEIYPVRVVGEHIEVKVECGGSVSV